MLLRTSLAAVLLAHAVAAQQPAPTILRHQVPNRGLANGAPFQLGQRTCQATLAGSRPFLVWDSVQRLDAPREPAAAATWLQRQAGSLQHGVFTPVFVASRDIDEHTVLVFSLQHQNVPLYDAEVWICFDEDGCVGLVNRVPAGLATPPAVPANATEPCFRSRRGRTLDDPDRLVLAERRRSTTASHAVVDFVHDGEVFTSELTPLPTAGTDATATFTVFSVGGFPDQIAADSRGLIWVSDPVQNRLMSLDPQTGVPTFYPTTGWTQPDGLCVDDKDRVWTGLYTTGNGLGRLEPATGTFTRFAPPYAGAQFAIPAWSANGTLWITDHIATRLTPFSIATSTFGTPLVLPAGSWPVGAAYESDTGDMFIPLYQSNGLAQIRNNALLAVRLAPVAAGPAFAATANGKVWFTYWSSGQVGGFDPRTLAFTTYNLVPGGQFGPIDVGPNGHVYAGTRTTGQLVDFNPVTGTAVNYTIPVGSWQMKDGLTVAPDGSVWFTSSAGTVVRVRLQ